MSNKLIGSYPVIGIRRVIESRAKSREKIEPQVVEMAQQVYQLYTENLRYPDGAPVKVVISEVSISSAEEAALCEEQFRREGVGITLSVTSSWCYGSETMDMNPSTIKGVWGFNSTESPGSIYLSAVLAAHNQKGLPVFTIYGHHVQEKDDISIQDDVREKLLRFARAAIAVKTIKGKNYLQIGAICMGIGGSIIDASFLEKYLGMRAESVDEIEVLRRIENEIYDKAEYERAIAWVRQNCKEGIDVNREEIRKTREQKDADWEFTVKCMLIIRDLMVGNSNIPEKFSEERRGHNAIAAGFQGQRQWTDIFPNTDFPESMLNSTFDWNGIREPYILATENDVLNAITMLLMKQLTAQAQIFADVRTCWTTEAVRRATGYEITGLAKEAGGFIHLINSGAACIDASGAVKNAAGEPVMKSWYDMTEKDTETLLNSVTWSIGKLDEGKGGYSSRFVTRSEMPVTMARINLVDGLGPVMQIAEGFTIHLPEDLNDVLWKRTDYTWPCTWFVPRCDGVEGSPFEDTYSVMENWGANHGAITYGHIGADLITLCSMLRIPVCMHNVPVGKIFRPSAWKAFGMIKEVQDYQACACFGPLYR